MNYSFLLKEIKNEVSRMYGQVKNPGLLYHNLEHTEQVVANCIKMGNYYKLNDRDLFTVVAAAWFHDSGFCLGKIDGHELASALLAESFLKEKGLDEQIIKGIRGCIIATTMPQQPTNLLEQIICDADLFHMGSELFRERNRLLRKELEFSQGKKIPKDEWRRNTITFMENHEFNSSYGKTILQKVKEKNIDKLRQKANEEEDETENVEINAREQSDNAGKEKAETKNKAKSDRSVETMFRIISSNNQKLSDMADNKAHIMITTTSIIISILLSVLVRKLEENPNLIIPAILLLTVCVSSMVLAILTTRPSLPSGIFNNEDLEKRKVNLIFFGNYYKMPFEDYNAGMQKVMSDREYLYGSLTKDSHSQGVVLGRKYRLLRIGYNVFMYGIIISVLAFVIAIFLGP